MESMTVIPSGLLNGQQQMLMQGKTHHHPLSFLLEAILITMSTPFLYSVMAIFSRQGKFEDTWKNLFRICKIQSHCQG